MRNDRERLRDIREAIEAIEKYAQKGKSAFLADELIQTWIIHHLIVLGEAAAKVSESFRESHADIFWSDIIGMRNVLVHHYFGIDLELIWSVVVKDLPMLRQFLNRVL